MHHIISCPAAELAIGNIVRRVLHMIREEHQQDDTLHEPAPSTSTAAKQPQARDSLLSQALGKPGRYISRVMSLSNLLDQVRHSLRHAVYSRLDKSASQQLRMLPATCSLLRVVCWLCMWRENVLSFLIVWAAVAQAWRLCAVMCGSSCAPA